MTHERWNKECSEPQWYYSLDQVVTDLLTQNGDVPLLAVAELGSSKRSVMWAPELLVNWRESQSEIDIAAIIDGKVVVGEAKSNSKLKTAKKSTDKAVSRFVGTARLLQADHIVLATTENSWAEVAVTAVEVAVKKFWTSGPLPTVSQLTNLRPRKQTPSKPDVSDV
ncbi:hypothetical protein [Kibdelosporangium aridum]|uniref:hypothetical protein n=1 Tax=Kibdelosporangium aridum TaxID=2030 RepID=UPI000A5B327D|nr:hypothetical protein [Kibdelosporangium aridum]